MVLDINECHSDPCMNGGTCVDGTFQYTCTCVNGYTGTHCETGMTVVQSFSLVRTKVDIYNKTVLKWHNVYE